MKFALIRGAMLALIWCCMDPRFAQAQTRSDDIAALLRTGTAEERARAVSAIYGMSVAERGPVIRTAILEELDRYRIELESRHADISAGAVVQPLADHGLYLSQLLDFLIEYNDPANIRSLVPFIGTGNRVMNALAAFGELAIDAVADVAASDESAPRDVSTALTTMRRMIGIKGRYALSVPSRTRVVSEASQRLTGTQEVTVLLSAIQLGVATGDAGLRRRIQTLARDADMVRAMGIARSDLVALVQERAKAVLGGSE